MQSILQILNELAATTKRTEKEVILKREINNDELKTVFWAAYSPDITYWISKHPAVQTCDLQGILGETWAISRLLDGLANRRYTGQAGINYYAETLALLTESQAEVIRRVVDRDLRCGVGIATINKIWPYLIPVYDFMLAETDPKKLKFPCYIQTKMDGVRCLITHTKFDEILMRTRNGNLITSLNAIHNVFCQIIPEGETWDGELVCIDVNGQILPRKISNGIINKALRNTISPQEVEQVVFVVWDIIDQTKTIPYKLRFQNLHDRLKSGGSKVLLVDNGRADDLVMIEQCFEQALARGEEGVIAKNIDSIWQPKRTFDLVKFKADKTADLLVIGWEEGKGKFKGRLGALVCESSDGKIKVNISGFTDKERDAFTPDFIVDSIIEVVYNSRITKKNGQADSLYLARFERIRYDKTTANSSEEIK